MKNFIAILNYFFLLQGLILSNALRAQKSVEDEGCSIALSNLRSEVIELRNEGLEKDKILISLVSKMKEDKANMESHSTFEGLWEFYLAKSWNQPFADRVNICDYNGMSHEDVLRKTAHTIKERDMGCTAIEGYRLTEWHP